MKVSISTRTSAQAPAKGLLAVALTEQDSERPKLGSRVQALDEKLGGAIAAAVRAGVFRGRAGDERMVHSNDKQPQRVLLLSFSRRAATSLQRRVGALLHQALGTAAIGGHGTSASHQPAHQSAGGG